MSKLLCNLTFNKGHNKMWCMSIILVRNGHLHTKRADFYRNCKLDKSELLAVDHITEQYSK